MPPDQLTKQQLVDYLCHHLEESDVVYSVFRLQQMKAAGLLEPWTGMEGLLTNHSWKRHSPLVEAVIHPDSLLRRMLFDLVFSFIPDPKATIAYQVAKDNGMSWAVKRMESWAREGQRRAHTAKRLFNLPMDKVVDWVQQQRNVPPQHELTQNGPLPPRPAALYAPASDQSAARLYAAALVKPTPPANSGSQPAPPPQQSRPRRSSALSAPGPPPPPRPATGYPAHHVPASTAPPPAIPPPAPLPPWRRPGVFGFPPPPPPRPQTTRAVPPPLTPTVVTRPPLVSQTALERPPHVSSTDNLLYGETSSDSLVPHGHIFHPASTFFDGNSSAAFQRDLGVSRENPRGGPNSTDNQRRTEPALDHPRVVVQGLGSTDPGALLQRLAQETRCEAVVEDDLQFSRAEGDFARSFRVASTALAQKAVDELDGKVVERRKLTAWWEMVGGPELATLGSLAPSTAPGSYSGLPRGFVPAPTAPTASTSCSDPSAAARMFAKAVRVPRNDPDISPPAPLPQPQVPPPGYSPPRPPFTRRFPPPPPAPLQPPAPLFPTSDAFALPSTTLEQSRGDAGPSMTSEAGDGRHEIEEGELIDLTGSGDSIAGADWVGGGGRKPKKAKRA